MLARSRTERREIQLDLRRALSPALFPFFIGPQAPDVKSGSPIRFDIRPKAVSRHQVVSRESAAGSAGAGMRYAATKKRTSAASSWFEFDRIIRIDHIGRGDRFGQDSDCAVASAIIMLK